VSSPLKGDGIRDTPHWNLRRQGPEKSYSDIKGVLFFEVKGGGGGRSESIGGVSILDKRSYGVR